MKNFVSQQWWLRLPLILFMLAVSLVHADPAKAQSFEYRLGPGDRMQVDVFGRSDLSGIYTVRNSGALSLPIAGEIPAVNLTLNQLETEIENRYSELMRSDSGPDQTMNVNIEIIKYRAFYIMGDVRQPGSYEYQPRLTVLRAVVIAGGYASSVPSSRINETRARENLNVLQSKYLAAIAREARLVAEARDLKEVTFPPGLLEMREVPFVAELLDIERKLFTLRRELFEQQMKIINRRKQQFGVEDEALESQTATVQRKRKEIDEVLGGAKSLSSEGLMPRFNLSSFVILQADIEKESRELLVAQSRAKQGVGEMEQQALILRGQRAREIASELVAVRLQIDETLLRLRAEADRLAILKVKTVTGPDSAEEKETAGILISRETDRGTISIDATDNTPVLPGDVISIPYQDGDAFLSLPDRGQN